MTGRDSVKAFLNSYLEAKRELNLLYAELAEMNSVLFGISYDGMPHGASETTSIVVRLNERIEAKKEDICQQLIVTDRARSDIKKVIQTLPNPIMREILTERYIILQTTDSGRQTKTKWEVLAEKMNYDVSTIKKLHTTAIDILFQKDSTKFH